VPGSAAANVRVCYVHAGTHKTGTTSVQRSLVENDELLAEAGIYVPRAGRVDGVGGHHNLAWELSADPRFTPDHGTIADFLAEIRGRDALGICVSSEDFEYAADRPGALCAFANLIRAAGFAAVAVLYLRPQAGYAESLYAELVKHGLAVPFSAFFDTIVATGHIRLHERWVFDFDYERLLDAFAAAFGHDHLIVRRYDADFVDVVEDFFALIGAAASSGDQRFRKSQRLNSSIGFDDVMRRFERHARADGTRRAGIVQPSAPGRFDPVALGDVVRVMRRFNAGNRRVLARYGVRIPCVSGRDLIDDLRAAVGADPASRLRHALTSATATDHPDRPRATWRPSLRLIGARVVSSPLARPARLEFITVIAAALVAVVSLAFGQQTLRTSLVEFGMLSVVAAASAGITTVRYIVEAQGLVADEPFLKRCGTLLRTAAFSAIGLYAAVNATLDVTLARHQPDWISYPGAFACVLAAIVFTLLLPAKQRLMQYVTGAFVARSLREESRYLRCIYVAAACEALHAFEPAWWVDTSIDVLVALLAIRTIAELARPASSQRVSI
jgi:hypothetical protein